MTDSVLTAPVDIHGATRLAALRASGLLDSPPEESYDALVKLAARILGAPVALLSLVDKDRQFFKAQVGLQEPWAGRRQTPLSHSFCQWVVSGRSQVTVEDARNHPVLKTNLAIRDLGVVAYAGVPVHTGGGEVLGSLCTIDGKPRPWAAQQVQLLKQLGRMVDAIIAQAELVRDPPRDPAGFDRYSAAAADAISAACNLLRHPNLTSADSELLLAQIERYAHNLVQVNRLLQVARALQ